MTQTNETPPETRQNCRCFDVSVDVTLRSKVWARTPQEAADALPELIDDDYGPHITQLIESDPEVQESL